MLWEIDIRQLHDDRQLVSQCHLIQANMVMTWYRGLDLPTVISFALPSVYSPLVYNHWQGLLC